MAKIVFTALTQEDMGEVPETYRAVIFILVPLLTVLGHRVNEVDIFLAELGVHIEVAGFDHRESGFRYHLLNLKVVIRVNSPILTARLLRLILPPVFPRLPPIMPSDSAGPILLNHTARRCLFLDLPGSLRLLLLAAAKE